MKLLTVIALVFVWSGFIWIADSATLRNKDGLDTPHDKFDKVAGDEEEWSNALIIIRVDTLNNGKEHVSLEHDFENTTLPPFLCWEMECPDCSKLESPQRCFTRGFLQVIIRSIIFGLVLVVLVLCVLIVNHKANASGGTKACNKKTVKTQTEKEDTEIDSEKKTSGNCMDTEYLINANYEKTNSTDIDC